MEVGSLRVYWPPGKEVLLHCIIPAFIHVGQDAPVEVKVLMEEPDETGRDLEVDFPAVFCPGGGDIKVLLDVFPNYVEAIFLPILYCHAAVGVYLEVEVILFPFDHEEKLKAAVAEHRGQGLRLFSPDVFFCRAHVDIQPFFIITELAFGAYSRIFQPQHLVYFQHRDPAPVHISIPFLYRVRNILHISLLNPFFLS